ncbi:MotA/TolQ/ExbB proton channel family protein [uncultured Desulfuromonas sp.]|uniref:MotA/TolQ/ExbB proton channel family protein n=1 Tax=uncultured Desulfuromonas sp. TaxID=181013 RepID=UPI002AAB8514|nr:MotA/TolQ/ExbB proton channel family protein [uncultured Desulfuromonas sp.]
MKTLKTLVIAALLLVAHSAFAASWQQISDSLTTMNQQGLSRAAMIEQLIHQDEADLKKALSQLRSKVKQQKQQLSVAQQALAKLSKVEQKLNQELAAEQEEIEGIQGTVLGAAKRVNDLFEHSPLGPQFAQQRQTIDTILEKKNFPGMDEIRALTALCRAYATAGSQVTLGNGEFFAEDGNVVRGEIARIGALGAVYRDRDNAGYLQANSDGRELVAVAGEIPGPALNAIDRFFSGEHSHLPLDISGGAVFLQMTQSKSFGEWLESGGFLVWPILAIGVIALLLAAERLAFFLRIRANSDTILHQVTRYVELDQIKEGEMFCREKKNAPTCQILASCLKQIGQTQEVLDNALEEALMKQMPRFEKFLPTMAMFAAIAPLLGLLGTVTGMISTFQVITVFGTGDPKMMSGGISEALITTQVGLAVAIPIMLLHHLFERRVDVLIGDMEEKGTAFKITLLKTGRITPQPQDSNHD